MHNRSYGYGYAVRCMMKTIEKQGNYRVLPLMIYQTLLEFKESSLKIIQDKIQGLIGIQIFGVGQIIIGYGGSQS